MTSVGEAADLQRDHRRGARLGRRAAGLALALLVPGLAGCGLLGTTVQEPIPPRQNGKNLAAEASVVPTSDDGTAGSPTTSTPAPGTTSRPAGTTSTTTAAPKTSTTTSRPASRTTTRTTARPASKKPTPARTTTAAGAGSGSASSSAEAEVLRLVNVERAKKSGCKPVTSDSTLVKVARAHSRDMAEKGYFSHDGKDGRDPFERMRDAGYRYSWAAENIAAGQGSAASVMKSWMNSSGHKANILNCKLTELGVGMWKDADSTYGIYWTQDFGTPR